MRATTEDDVDWDFTPVSDLIFSLSEAADPRPDGYSSPSPSPERITTPTFSPNHAQSKSDLGNFDRLWTYLGQPLDLPPPDVPPRPEGYNEENAEETTELHLAISKGVRWRDDTAGGELADVEEADNKSVLSGMTKLQREKLRKKERKAAQEEKNHGTVPPTSSSENDSEAEPQTLKRPPDRRAIIQQILHGSTQTPDGYPSPNPEPPRASLPIDPGAWPVANPRFASSLPGPRTPIIDQTALVVAARKKESLERKLEKRFIDDRPFLSSMSMTTFTSTDNAGMREGIHVFVDASNIMIGFHDSIKISRGMPVQARLRRQPLSFDRLALVLERGRPASKRVLVGSDNYDAIEEAKRIGYEANILDRVLKAKELTPRQKKFSTRSNGNGTSGGSGSETTAAAVFAKEKWVEQAVDEILHLKILESVVDAKEPSTMVLATGDAAEAEYSQGFLRMAERALEKGWKVELVSFRKNMSGMYKRKDFRAKWQGRFKIVELDDFLDELLGHEVR